MEKEGGKARMHMENDLGRDKIGRLVIRIALPSMLAQFVSVLYSIVDRMYIGNIPEVGDIALAGVGVSGPVVTLISSFAFLIGIGGSPLMSMKMGEQKLEDARKILANCFLMLSVLSVLLMAAALLGKEQLLMWFGASAVTFPYANDYFTVYLMGTVFALLSVGMNQFIICQGFARAGMFSVLIGAVLNILLDPLFIFTLDMGVKGAALATVLSQAASCIYVLCFLFGKYVPVRITFGGYSGRIMRKVLSIGITPFIIIALDNVMIIAMNALLQRYGGAEGDRLLTCATILQSFMLVVTMPLGGITGGTQTILGYNYGARRPDRVLQAQRYIIVLDLIYTSIMFLVAMTVPQYFVRIFTQNEELIQLTVWAIRVSTIGIIPLAIQYEIVDGFTAIGKVHLALPLSFFRKATYFTSIFLLPALGGTLSIFYAEAISDFCGTAMSVVVYCLVIRKVLRLRENPAETMTEKE
jgi:putative MATE family efflux protein